MVHTFGYYTGDYQTVVSAGGEELWMRIEGTYIFPAPIEDVFSTLTHPDMLGQIIPGCERLVQLGPSVGEQPIVYEVRLRCGPGADVYTLTLTLSAVQSPTHLRADLEGHGPDGPFSGHGLLDLVQQDEQTLVASDWEIKSPVLAGLHSERRTAWNGSAEQFAGALRDHAISALRGKTLAPASAGVRHLTTPRGRVVVMPKGSMALEPELRVWLRRAALVGGLLAGLAAIGVIVAVVRRLTGASEPDDSSAYGNSSDT
jgi:carbon monoxide dehydrogenase subunit G